ncbi:MAG: UPF0104 family protein [Lautropia sp.]
MPIARARATPARGRLRRLRPWLLGAYFGVVAVLLAVMARELDWAGIVAAMRGMPRDALLAAGAFAVASHLTYSTFDLAGRAYTGHTLGVGRTMATTFVCYATTLSLGSLVGGVGLRYRLYARQGLALGQVTRITALSIAGNWLGYLALAALLLSCFANSLVAGAPGEASGSASSAAGAWLAPGWWRAAGGAMALVVLGVLACSAVGARRRIRARGVDVVVPPPSIVLALLLLAAANWALMAAVVHSLLDGSVGYEKVLFALLASAIAGVITHVPAGVGVFEASFGWLLAGSVDSSTLFAALLAYRGVYYLVPLAFAALGYLALERSARGMRPGEPRTGVPASPAR